MKLLGKAISPDFLATSQQPETEFPSPPDKEAGLFFIKFRESVYLITF